MGADPVFYALPEDAPRPLGIAPRLAGWVATGHPDQVHVRAFVTHAQQVLGPPPVAGGPAALRLDVGLPDDVRLLDQYGLAHYLGPLVEWLGARGWDFASVWATKSPGADSGLRVGVAQHVEPPVGDRRVALRIGTSAGSPAYTREVRDQLAGETSLPFGALALQLSFTVSPGCNWAGLWQPTLDGLSPLLGPTADDRPEEPSDGRVVELGLHRREDPAVGHEVEITGVLRLLPGDGAAAG